MNDEGVFTPNRVTKLDISYGERYLLSQIIYRATEGGVCDDTNAQLGEAIGMKPREVSTTLNKLVTRGLVATSFFGQGNQGRIIQPNPKIMSGYMAASNPETDSQPNAFSVTPTVNYVTPTANYVPSTHRKLRTHPTQNTPAPSAFCVGSYIGIENSKKNTKNICAKPVQKSTPKQDKPKPEKPPINIPFDTWWSLYEKKVGRVDCEPIWPTLTDADRLLIIDHTRQLVANTPKQFRKDPVRYLKKKAWLDEVIARDAPTHSATNTAPVITTYQPGQPD